MQVADDVLVYESIREPERFAPLFDRHAAAVHRYLARRIGEPADDLLAETFLVAFRRRASYRPMQLDVRPWLFGIATNVLYRHVRQEERRYRALARARRLEASWHLDDPSDDRLDAQALRAELATALAALKPADRTRCCCWPGPSSRTPRSPPRSTSRSEPYARGSTGPAA